MNINDYINGKKEIQEKILSLLAENKTGDALDLSELIQSFKNHNIFEDINEFRSILHLIENITNHHHRLSHFYEIIEKILIIFKNDFRKYLTNSDIFNIFYTNNRIILFLIENQILTLDFHIFNYIKDRRLKNYYFKEIKPFLKEADINEISAQNMAIEPDPEIFDQYRKNGENEKTICKLIRNDQIDEFIIYVTKNNISLETSIQSSIFETNYYLKETEVSLIEYAAFFGSLEIFNYLRLNNVEMYPTLWYFAIHGQNGQIIHLLEENHITPSENIYHEFFIESIKCHHNDIADYINDSFLKYNEINENESIKSQIIASYNYHYFNEENFVDQNSFFEFCRKDHYYLAKHMLVNNIISDVEFVKKIHFDDTGFDIISTPFLIAIANDNSNIVELLIDRPEIDINFQCLCILPNEQENCFNSLYYSVLYNNSRILKLLLNHKDIDFSSKTTTKYYSLQTSTNNITESSPLIEAVNANNLDILKLLLSYNQFDINTKYYSYDSTFSKSINDTTLIRQAIANKSTDILQVLLNNPKIDVNLKSAYSFCDRKIYETPLCYSIFNNDYEMTKLLLNHQNIDVNMTSNYLDGEEAPLFIAVKNNNIEIVKLLLNNKNLDINYKNQGNKMTALYMAILSRNEEIANCLLAHPKIDVNLRSLYTTNRLEFNETPLCIAINKKMYKMVEILLKHPNIDVNAPSTYKDYSYEVKTGLFIAIEKDYEILKILLNQDNIDLNYKCTYISNSNAYYNEYTVLHKAFLNQNCTVIKLLLNHKNINVNIRSINKRCEKNIIEIKERTILDHAICLGNIEIINLILSNNELKFNMKTKNIVSKPDSFISTEKDPLQIAVTEPNIEVFKIIYDYFIKKKQLDTNYLKKLYESSSITEIRNIILKDIK